MKCIFIPGLVASPLHLPSNYDELNLKLFHFWKTFPWTKDKSYQAYLKLCNQVCKAICQKNYQNGFQTKLIGHSSGCTIILDKGFKINEMKGVHSIEFLSPNIYAYYPPAFFGINIIAGKGFGLLVEPMLRLQSFIMGPLILTKASLLIHLALFESRKNYPLFDWNDLSILITMKQFASFFIEFTKTSKNFNKKIFENHKVCAMFASKDFIISAEESERFLLENGVKDIKWIQGDHESTIFHRTRLRNLTKPFICVKINNQ